MGESPDQAVNRLNYTLDRGVFPNQGGVARSGKSAVLIVDLKKIQFTLKSKTWQFIVKIFFLLVARCIYRKFSRIRNMRVDGWETHFTSLLQTWLYIVLKHAYVMVLCSPQLIKFKNQSESDVKNIFRKVKDISYVHICWKTMLCFMYLFILMYLKLMCLVDGDDSVLYWS